MNRYLIKGEAITEVVAIDEADAKIKFMEMLTQLNYHFPSIKRLEIDALQGGK
jgi:hypothetical protein